MIDLHRARELAEKGELDAAWKMVDEALRVDPYDPRALILATFILEKSDRPTLGYHIAKMLTERHSKEWAGWLNFGRCADHIWRMDEAIAAYERALELAKNDNDRATTHVNLSAVYVQIGQFDQGLPHAQAALTVKPENRKARHNLGVCQLAMRQWPDGWANYSASIGSQYRPHFQYAEEPTWDGTKGQTVIVYGEQGLGDEINGASMIGDLIRDAGRVVIDCDSRLTGLFRRSFPLAKVYGTRAKRSVLWDAEDQKPDASISAMELGGFYRQSDDAFPGRPYLVTDPVRTKAWKHTFAEKRKPVIGIAWSGGAYHTGAPFRRWSLDDMLPLFRAIDAHWVCLQYKDAADEIAEFRKRNGWVDIEQYAYATLTPDYDDTAALVAGCDMVICMQTAVAHLCGAIGKACWVFLPLNSQWRYYGTDDRTLWYGDAVRVLRQRRRGEWTDVIFDASQDLAKMYAQAVAA